MIAFAVALGKHILRNDVRRQFRFLTVEKFNLTCLSIEEWIGMGPSNKGSNELALASSDLSAHHGVPYRELDSGAQARIIRIGVRIVVMVVRKL